MKNWLVVMLGVGIFGNNNLIAAQDNSLHDTGTTKFNGVRAYIVNCTNGTFDESKKQCTCQPSYFLYRASSDANASYHGVRHDTGTFTTGPLKGQNYDDYDDYYVNAVIDTWKCLPLAPVSMKNGGDGAYYGTGEQLCPEVVNGLGGKGGKFTSPAKNFNELISRFENFNSRCSVLNHDAFRQQFCDFVQQDIKTDKAFYSKNTPGTDYGRKQFKIYCGVDLPE